MKAAVIYDGGFAEQGAEGRALQARIAAICLEAGIALCGPNCMGILNPHHKSTTYLQELRDPAGLAGNVAIVSHSGGLCVGLLTDTRRFGFSHIVSSGNEATCERGGVPRIPPRGPAHRDRRRVHRDDPGARALRRRARPRRRAGQAGRDGQGRSRTSAPGGRSRPIPAAMPTTPPPFPHCCARMARSRSSDIVELAEMLAAFQTAQRPAGRRLAVITSSGGLAELILDIAAETGIELPPLSPAQKAEIEPGSVSSPATATRSTPGAAAPSPPICRWR